MAALNESGVENVVRFRLKVAKVDPGLFQVDALQTLHVNSTRNRRIIMNLADNAMSLAINYRFLPGFKRQVFWVRNVARLTRSRVRVRFL